MKKKAGSARSSTEYFEEEPRTCVRIRVHAMRARASAWTEPDLVIPVDEDDLEDVGTDEVEELIPTEVLPQRKVSGLLPPARGTLPTLPQNPGYPWFGDAVGATRDCWPRPEARVSSPWVRSPRATWIAYALMAACILGAAAVHWLRS
jgi:hypothetical protein